MKQRGEILGMRHLSPGRRTNECTAVSEDTPSFTEAKSFQK